MYVPDECPKCALRELRPHGASGPAAGRSGDNTPPRKASGRLVTGGQGAAATMAELPVSGRACRPPHTWFAVASASPAQHETITPDRRACVQTSCTRVQANSCFSNGLPLGVALGKSQTQNLQGCL